MTHEEKEKKLSVYKSRIDGIDRRLKELSNENNKSNKERMFTYMANKHQIMRYIKYILKDTSDSDDNSYPLYYGKRDIPKKYIEIYNNTDK